MREWKSFQQPVGRRPRSNRKPRKEEAESDSSVVSVEAMNEVPIADLPTEDEIDATDFESNYYLPTVK